MPFRNVLITLPVGSNVQHGLIFLKEPRTISTDFLRDIWYNGEQFL
jgi:hypothetical protein